MSFSGETIMAISGDAGLMMNSQEIETTLRCNIAMAIMI